MKPTLQAADIELFSTCPPSNGAGRGQYRRQIAEAAGWSEKIGCRGMLVYSDNSQVDPWLVSHLIVQETESLCPLVAVQPIYMHPYTVAKAVASIGCLYGRRVYLNMVAGGFKNDLVALNDETPHESRYARLIEYTRIIKALLGGGPVSYEGRFYKVDKLKLSPPPAASLFPGIFVSGSSAEGLAAAEAISATAIKYPKPAKECRDAPRELGDSGIRVGIIWHRQLSELAQESEPSPYWLVPFQNYKSMCPYLVGDYDRVGEELATYVSYGFRTFILDIPPSADELIHTRNAFDRALKTLPCRSSSSIG
jgi:alkanesulfonate monooxygenase